MRARFIANRLNPSPKMAGRRLPRRKPVLPSQTATTVRVRELRERLGIAPFDLTAQHLDERIVPSCLEGIPV